MASAPVPVPGIPGSQTNWNAGLGSRGRWITEPGKETGASCPPHLPNSQDHSCKALLKAAEGGA